MNRYLRFRLREECARLAKTLVKYAHTSQQVKKDYAKIISKHVPEFECPKCGSGRIAHDEVTGQYRCKKCRKKDIDPYVPKSGTEVAIDEDYLTLLDLIRDIGYMEGVLGDSWFEKLNNWWDDLPSRLRRCVEGFLVGILVGVIVFFSVSICLLTEVIK